MDSIFIIIGIIAAVILSVLADWFLKELLPPNPKLRHLIVGLLACIVLVSVITWSELRKLDDTSSPVTYQTSQSNTDTVIDVATNTPVLNPNTPTITPMPTIQQEPSIMPTETAAARIISTPQVIKSGNKGVAITVRDLASNNEHNMYFQALAGGVPLSDIEFDFYEVSQDITGNWVLADRVSDFINARTDLNGVIQGTLPLGMYAIRPDWHSGIFGTWGIESANGEIIVFPISSEQRTEIVLSLAIIEIGVISLDGEALHNKSVYAECQGVDIADNIISDEERCDDHNWGHTTDRTGLSQILVGAGTYIIGINYAYYYGRDTYLTDVVVVPGEVYRKIFTYDYPGD